MPVYTAGLMMISVFYILFGLSPCNAREKKLVTPLELTAGLLFITVNQLVTRVRGSIHPSNQKLLVEASFIRSVLEAS